MDKNPIDRETKIISLFSGHYNLFKNDKFFTRNNLHYYTFCILYKGNFSSRQQTTFTFGHYITTKVNIVCAFLKKISANNTKKGLTHIELSPFY